MRGLALALLLIPAVAHARVVNVEAPDGIGRLNATMQAGDVALLAPGEYVDFPEPRARATGGLRFTFIAAPGASIPGGRLAKPYVTLRGFTVHGNFGCEETADRDSILDCVVSGSFDHQGGDYDTYARCRFDGTHFDLNKATLAASSGVTIIECEFPRLGQGVDSGDHLFLVWDADSTTMMFCRKDIIVEAGLPKDLGAEWHFDDRHLRSRGNHTRITLDRASYAVWRWRSDTSLDHGCYGNQFARDTIVVTGPGGGDVSQLLPSSSADCAKKPGRAQCIGAWDATMDSCVIDGTAVGGAGCAMIWQGGMTGWSIVHTVFRMTGPAIEAFDIHRSRLAGSTLVGNPALRWRDQYQRPLWRPGDMTVTGCTIDGGVRFDRRMTRAAGAYKPSRNTYLTPFRVPAWPKDATSNTGRRGAVHPRARAARRVVLSRRRLAVYGAAGMLALGVLGAGIVIVRNRAKGAA